MSDFKKKYLKYKNKYLKTKIMMYGGSRNFSIVDDISIRIYPDNLFVCQVYFKDPIRATKKMAFVQFNSDDPEGDFIAYDETYFFTDLEILQMKEQARIIAYPKIKHLFDQNELKKFYERKPEIDKELANELRKEKEEEQQKIRREQYERERPERERKLEEERMRKLEEERMRKLEEERIRKEAEENRRKIREIMKSLEEKILSKNIDSIDSAIDEYMNIEQSLNEDDKKTIKKVFYYYIFEKRNPDIKKVERLLNLNIINGQKIIDWYINFLIPLDILELLLSRSNENLKFPEWFFKSQFDIIKKRHTYEKKENLSNNLKILLNKYKIDYN